MGFKVASRTEKKWFSDFFFLTKLRNELEFLTTGLEKEIDITVYGNIFTYLNRLEKEFDTSVYFEKGSNKVGEWFYVLKIIFNKIKAIRAFCTTKIESQELNKHLEALNKNPSLLFKSNFFRQLEIAIIEYKKAILAFSNVIQMGNLLGKKKIEKFVGGKE